MKAGGARPWAVAMLLHLLVSLLVSGGEAFNSDGRAPEGRLAGAVLALENDLSKLEEDGPLTNPFSWLFNSKEISTAEISTAGMGDQNRPLDMSDTKKQQRKQDNEKAQREAHCRGLSMAIKAATEEVIAHLEFYTESSDPEPNVDKANVDHAMTAKEKLEGILEGPVKALQTEVFGDSFHYPDGILSAKEALENLVSTDFTGSSPKETSEAIKAVATAALQKLRGPNAHPQDVDYRAGEGVLRWAQIIDQKCGAKFTT